MQHPRFYTLASRPNDYPAVRIPSQPVPHWAAFWTEFLDWIGCPVASAFLDEPLSFFSLGRYALAEAMRRAGVGEGTAVLLPAYHCRSMVEPVMYLNAVYPMTTNLQPDLSAASELARDGKVRALVMTHYFGFANALETTQAFCASLGIVIIEDCAHALYGKHDGKPLGTSGQYATASTWKFLPVRGGAMLRDNSGGAIAKLRTQPLLSEIKTCAAMVEIGLKRLIQSRSLPAINAAELRERAKNIADQLARMNTNDIGIGPPTFQKESAEKSGLYVTRGMVWAAAHRHTAHQRRKNYLRWLEVTQDIPGIRPFFPDLPGGIVPYVFPILTEHGEIFFHTMKLAGIPLYRWEDMAMTDCPVSQDYRLRLLRLPCHQGLRSQELDWMLDVLRKVSYRYAG